MDIGALSSIKDDELFEIDGRSTKDVAGVAAVVSGVSGADSFIASKCGATSLSAGLATIAGGALAVAGYCCLFPAP